MESVLELPRGFYKPGVYAEIKKKTKPEPKSEAKSKKK